MGGGLYVRYHFVKFDFKSDAEYNNIDESVSLLDLKEKRQHLKSTKQFEESLGMSNLVYVDENFHDSNTFFLYKI